jgi:hypothetical protein
MMIFFVLGLFEGSYGMEIIIALAIVSLLGGSSAVFWAGMKYGRKKGIDQERRERLLVETFSERPEQLQGAEQPPQLTDGTGTYREKPKTAIVPIGPADGSPLSFEKIFLYLQTFNDVSWDDSLALDARVHELAPRLNLKAMKPSKFGGKYWNDDEAMTLLCALIAVRNDPADVPWLVGLAKHDFKFHKAFIVRVPGSSLTATLDCLKHQGAGDIKAIDVMIMCRNCKNEKVAAKARAVLGGWQESNSGDEAQLLRERLLV